MACEILWSFCVPEPLKVFPGLLLVMIERITGDPHVVNFQERRNVLEDLSASLDGHSE